MIVLPAEHITLSGRYGYIRLKRQRFHAQDSNANARFVRGADSNYVVFLGIYCLVESFCG
jgi:hypothetical protein